MERAAKPFMSATWRHLVMLNYRVDAELLAPLLPAGTELDTWQGQHFVSVVGFLFEHSKIRGVPIPLHGSFEEINLRFYVKRTVDDEVRRAVVFVKEIVPLRAVALIARVVYGENYVAMPMSHAYEMDEANRLCSVEYGWKHKGQNSRMGVRLDGNPVIPAKGSIEEFIAEHYWGYTKLRGGRTGEYRVEHPSWSVCAASSAWLDCDIAGLYGERFSEFLKQEPASAFLADGSDVNVYPRRVLGS